MSTQVNQVKDAIKAYLDKRAKEDRLFAASYAKPNKSIDECFDYIIGEVRKKGTMVYMSDEEVFGMAVHYYDEDDIKVSKLPNGERVNATTHQALGLTEEEMQKIKKQAAEAYKQQEAAGAAAAAQKMRESLVGITIVESGKCDLFQSEPTDCKKLILADGSHICVKDMTKQPSKAQ